ncbi:MAG TPA: D-alanyl-D-alanine carboxypeptidase family protein [Peptostreptococcaceae bacterium]|nr:D-alanyl-D-alanine carboxypeptidase family protein [Peptostreptococcaceae bacterium]
MKKIMSMIVALAIVLSCTTVTFAKDQATLNLASKSAVLMDVGSGQVLFEKNSHEKLPPASVTKVMTLLLISEALDSGKIKLTDKVQISERAAEMGGSQIFLEPGEIQTVENLVKGIAVASGNDACVAMAEYIGGSEENFVKMMNNKAKELGMKDTNFVNTNGLPVENHYTTANDIALMSKELLKHDSIHKYLTTWMDEVVVGKKQAKIGLANTNKLIRHYQGATGVKTGFTQEAKYCLSAAAKRGDTHLVAATLGAETSKERFNDASSLLNYGFANYESVKLCSKGDLLATLTMDKAEENKVKLTAKNDLTALIKKGEKKNFTKEVTLNENPKLPMKKGEKLGEVKIYKDKKLVGKVDLVTNKEVKKAGYIKMIERLFYSMI